MSSAAIVHLGRVSLFCLLTIAFLSRRKVPEIVIFSKRLSTFIHMGAEKLEN